tara:strand:+ start:514 stop:687 length:174 start_codon:yes stop_codon:yes gene_type:complete
MDIVIGKHSFNAQTLKSISKEKAVKSFKTIDKEIIERAWMKANPKRTKRKSPKKTKE